MDFLKFIQTFWPIAVTIASFVSLAVLLWLRTQFPTKAELSATKDEILAKIAGHQTRLDQGGEKIAGIDKRLAVVEADCDSQPSKEDLNQGQTVLAGRISGVESAIRGVERELEANLTGLRREVGTGNDLLQILIEQSVKAGGK